MRQLKAINKNPAEQTLANYLTAVNAFAKMEEENGRPAQRLSASNAKNVLKGIIKSAVSLFNPNSVNHNKAFNAFSGELGKNTPALNVLENIGQNYFNAAHAIATNAEKGGIKGADAIEFAYNSLAGNPVFDHFGNLNLLAGQLYQERSIMNTFLENGDMMSVPIEAGGTGMAKSRFRAPRMQITGSSKILQGDINPTAHTRDDANSTQIDLYNEFKNAVMFKDSFYIDQAMREQSLGYTTAVSPALGGFILQNEYFGGSLEHIMSLAEVASVDGLDTAGNYTQNVGGSYGLLSSAVQLALGDYQAANPAPASAANWAANPTKLIQVISNYNYVPITVAGQLPTNLDPTLFYLDVIRLFTLVAQTYVDFKPKEYVLLVPTTIYGLLVQYPGTITTPGQGTYNKNLNELIESATSGIINKIRIVPSALMNYRATNSYGSTASAFNYMMAIPMGSEPRRKAIIMPGQTATPYVVSQSVSADQMDFQSRFLFGGPMVMQYNGAVLMKFNKAS